MPGEFIACLEWRRLSNDQMRREIHSRRRHFFNRRVSMVNYVSSETRPEEMLVDESAGATVRQLGDALDRAGGQRPLLRRVLAHAGSPRHATSQSLDRAAAEATKAMAAHDGVLRPRVLQPAERLAVHRPRQQRQQRPTAGTARNELRGSELSVHPRTAARPSAPISSARRSRSSRPGTRRRTTSICTSTTSGTPSCSAPPAAARASC